MHTLFHCTMTSHCKTPTTIITITPFFKFKIDNHQAHKIPLLENMHKLITFPLCWPCKVNHSSLSDSPSYARLDCFSFGGFLMRWRHPLKFDWCFLPRPDRGRPCSSLLGVFLSCLSRNILNWDFLLSVAVLTVRHNGAAIAEGCQWRIR